MTLRRTGLFVLVLVAVVFAACGSAAPKPTGDPDPGGRILRSLEPTAAVVPARSKWLSGLYDREPFWDSCDGMTGTYGWDGVVVQRVFTTRLPAAAVRSHAKAVMGRLGWLAVEDGTGTLGWRRGDADATLQPETRREWQFDAEAPPNGRQPTGC